MSCWRKGLGALPGGDSSEGDVVFVGEVEAVFEVGGVAAVLGALGDFELDVLELVEMVGEIREGAELEAAEAEVLDEVGHGVDGDDFVVPEEAVGVGGADDAQGPLEHGGAGGLGLGEFDVVDVDVVAAVGDFVRDGSGVVELAPEFGVELGKVNGRRAHTYKWNSEAIVLRIFCGVGVSLMRGVGGTEGREWNLPAID